MVSRASLMLLMITTAFVRAERHNLQLFPDELDLALDDDDTSKASSSSEHDVTYPDLIKDSLMIHDEDVRLKPNAFRIQRTNDPPRPPRQTRLKQKKYPIRPHAVKAMPRVMKEPLEMQRRHHHQRPARIPSVPPRQDMLQQDNDDVIDGWDENKPMHEMMDSSFQHDQHDQHDQHHHRRRHRFHHHPHPDHQSSDGPKSKWHQDVPRVPMMRHRFRDRACFYRMAFFVLQGIMVLTIIYLFIEQRRARRQTMRTNRAPVVNGIGHPIEYASEGYYAPLNEGYTSPATV